jgi:UDPglucose--hexose-1-phosphate uridylyltransferase
MSEARYDWLGDRWIILSPDRQSRPNDFAKQFVGSDANATCPFCFGNEADTPPPILEIGRESNPAGTWLVRVFANKYPATFPFTADAADDVAGEDSTESSLPVGNVQTQRDGHAIRNQGDEDNGLVSVPIGRNLSQVFHGSHEVIVESSEHLNSISQLSASHMVLAVTAYRDRLATLRSNPLLQYAVLFKNTGPEAGASLFHTHSQLIACNLTPPSYKRLLSRLKEYHSRSGNCYLCDTIAEELTDKQRLIAETDCFVAYCPYASRLPFTAIIAPKKHGASFEDLCSEQLQEFAVLLQRAARWIEGLHEDSSYNFVVRTMPWSCRDPRTYHWNVEIFPRLSKIAGFEWASDCFINTEIPENAARRYREIDALQNSR